VKTFAVSRATPVARVARSAAAFTLPEVIISAALFVLLVGGVVTSNLFGMRMFQIADARLRAKDGVRKAVGSMAEDIRKCRNTWVGDVTNGTFVACMDNQAQMGSALLVQQTTNTTNCIVYFLEPSDHSFRRTTVSPAVTRILAQTVTNTVIFRAQDCFGNILTNSQNNRVVHVTLDFFQAQPWLPAPDHGQIELSVTRRKLE
jgi:hypothetical protein